MMYRNTAEISVSQEMMNRYFERLINRLFKILPMRENDDQTLCVYIQSLQFELLGFGDLIDMTHSDELIISLASILQSLIDNDLELPVVKREVFHMIDICVKLRGKYAEANGATFSVGGVRQ